MQSIAASPLSLPLNDFPDRCWTWTNGYPHARLLCVQVCLKSTSCSTCHLLMICWTTDCNKEIQWSQVMPGKVPAGAWWKPAGGCHFRTELRLWPCPHPLLHKSLCWETGVLTVLIYTKFWLLKHAQPKTAPALYLQLLLRTAQAAAAEARLGQKGHAGGLRVPTPSHCPKSYTSNWRESHHRSKAGVQPAERWLSTQIRWRMHWGIYLRLDI